MYNQRRDTSETRRLAFTDQAVAATGCLMVGVSVEAGRGFRSLFPDLNKREARDVAPLLKARWFADGETIVQTGSGGAAFFVGESGEAAATVGGNVRARSRPAIPSARC